MTTTITRVRPADQAHQVLTVEGGSGAYRKQPCPGCPWRTSNIGEFPAEAFRHSANTAYDMSNHRFGCHESGTHKPATCAGFLLRGSDHNLAVRIDRMKGRIKDDVNSGGHEIFENYRAMAIANGVPKDDPAIASCR